MLFNYKGLVLPTLSAPLLTLGAVECSVRKPARQGDSVQPRTEPQAECRVKRETDLSPVRSAQVLTLEACVKGREKTVSAAATGPQPTFTFQRSRQAHALGGPVSFATKKEPTQRTSRRIRLLSSTAYSHSRSKCSDLAKLILPCSRIGKATDRAVMFMTVNPGGESKAPPGLHEEGPYRSKDRPRAAL